MKILKRIGLVFLALITLLALWIAINSIDDAELSPLAKEMLKPFPEVPPEENGYNDVSYLGAKDGFEKTINIDPEVVRQLYSGKIDPNSKTGKSLLGMSNFEKLLNDIQKSNDKPRFKFPEVNDFSDKLISYQEFLAAWKLIIIHSRIAAKNNNINEALGLIKTNLDSTEKMQSEENHLLISYLVPIAGISSTLFWSHEMTSNFDMGPSEYKHQLSIINGLRDFRNDGFKETSTADYMLLNSDMSERLRASPIERLKDRNKYIEQWITVQSFYAQIKDRYAPIIYGTAISIFPRYYIHKNNILNTNASIYHGAYKYADYSCIEIPVHELSPSSGQTRWELPLYKDIVMPNSYSWIVTYTEANWLSYSERRCLYHSYISAIKIITAIHWYQSERHKLPDTLDELTPNYLKEIPIDYFDGKPMRYSKENRWVYSVGADYHDDGGSKDTFFRGGCSGAFGKNSKAEVDACRMNPTVPINWNNYPAELR